MQKGEIGIEDEIWLQRGTERIGIVKIINKKKGLLLYKIGK